MVQFEFDGATQARGNHEMNNGGIGTHMPNQEQRHIRDFALAALVLVLAQSTHAGIPGDGGQASAPQALASAAAGPDAGVLAHPETTPSFPALPAWPTREGDLKTADGVRLHYRVVGKRGEPLLFLHGGPGFGMHDGGFDLEALAAQRFRYFMFDQRGAGQSDVVKNAEQLQMANFVADVEAVRKHFGLRHFGLIGLSWGSSVALKYAVAHPERVTRIVFLSPMSPDISLWKERQSALKALKTEGEIAVEKAARERLPTASDDTAVATCREFLEPTRRLYILDLAHAASSRTDLCDAPAEMLRSLPYVIRTALWENLGEFDFRADMRRIRVPSLVIEGAATKVPLEATREWARTLPGARLLLVQNAGHQSWIDQPDAVLSSIGDFFRHKWPAGAEVVGSR